MSFSFVPPLDNTYPIHLFKVHPMKMHPAIKALVLSSIYLMMLVPAHAQCSNGSAPITVTYDTTVFGNGYDDFSLAFPQFDPSLGTLISANLQTDLTLKYSFQLENDNLSLTRYMVRVTRDDLLTYPGGSDERPVSKSYGPYYLLGSDGVSDSGPDYVQVGPVYPFKNYITNYLLTSNLAGFLGNGTANVQYNTNSLVNALGGIYTRFSGQAFDTIKLSITYSYCPTAFLPADIIQFDLKKLTTGDIDVRWTAPNDQVGTNYSIQKSADGRVYTPVTTITSISNLRNDYESKYVLRKEDNRKIFFRIKETGPDGKAKYSSVKAINILDNTIGQMKIYPTVSSGYFNISFQEAARADWKVTLYSIGGTVMDQAYFSKTNFIRFSAHSKLKPGLYFVTAENSKSNEIQKSKIIIQ